MRRSSTLQHFGEDRLIAALSSALPSRSDVRIGVGDDCAVIGGPKDSRWRLLKTDAVVEGVHFAADEAMDRVGWKAACRTFSDFAAMGGTPEHVLVTLALPPRMAVRHVKAFYRGLCRACRRFGVAVVGGETSRSPGPFFCSIAAAGSVDREAWRFIGLRQASRFRAPPCRGSLADK
jgi:thiamine-monophosphate kinase